MTSLHTQETKFLLRLSFVIFLYYSIAQKPLQGITISFQKQRLGITQPYLLRRWNSAVSKSPDPLLLYVGLSYLVPEHNYLCFHYSYCYG